MATTSEIELPGLDCGLCGFPSCAEMAGRLDEKPELLKRCRARTSRRPCRSPAP